MKGRNKHGRHGSKASRPLWFPTGTADALLDNVTIFVRVVGRLVDVAYRTKSTLFMAKLKSDFHDIFNRGRLIDGMGA